MRANSLTGIASTAVTLAVLFAESAEAACTPTATKYCVSENGNFQITIRGLVGGEQVRPQLTLYTGTTFPDAAISEIVVYDDQPGTTATVRDVKASSEFPSDAEGSYLAVQAADGVKDTFWCEGNKATDGVGGLPGAMRTETTARPLTPEPEGQIAPVVVDSTT